MPRPSVECVLVDSMIYASHLYVRLYFDRGMFCFYNCADVKYRLFYSVRELATASPERKEVIMVETFEERRKWITVGEERGPGIKTIMQTYPVFHTDVDQVSVCWLLCQYTPLAFRIVVGAATSLAA